MESMHVKSQPPVRRRGCLPLMMVLNVILIGLAGILIVAQLADFATPFCDCDNRSERLITFAVVITATTDPNVTPMVHIISATPLPGEPNVAQIPDEVRDETRVPGAPVATIAPELFGENGLYQGDPELLPENCIQHVVADGEFPSLIAQEYDVDLFTLMAVNRLSEESALLLQIGDVLIVPLEGCPIEAFIDQSVQPGDATTAAPGEETPEITTEPSLQFTPTVTLAPTAANAQMEIVDVVGAGDMTT